jgi:hypothetical protein
LTGGALRSKALRILYIVKTPWLTSNPLVRFLAFSMKDIIMAKTNLQRTVSVALSSDLPKGSEIEKTELVGPVQPTSDNGAKVEGETPMTGEPLDNVTGSNKAPAIVRYKPETADRAHAVEAIIGMGADLRLHSEQIGSKLDQLALMVTDYAYYMFEDSKTNDKPLGKTPALKDLQFNVKLILDGKISVKTDATGKMTIERVVETKAQKDAIAEAKKLDPKGLNDKSLTFQTVSDATFNQYIPTACMVALLVLYGEETVIYGEPGKKINADGTTYRKGLRWISKGVYNDAPHNGGDPVLMNLGTATREKFVPYSLDTDAPEGSYLGIILHDHLIHPNVETSYDSEKHAPIYQSRVSIAKYRSKPWIGMTLQGVQRDYERFFGKETAAVITWPKTDSMTGYPFIEGRAPKTPEVSKSLTPQEQASAKEAEAEAKAKALLEESEAVKAIPTDIAKVTLKDRLPTFQHLKEFVFSLVPKSGAYSEPEKEIMADILARLSDIMDAIDGSDDPDKSIDRAMKK